jgi:hypothetical protein
MYAATLQTLFTASGDKAFDIAPFFLMYINL